MSRSGGGFLSRLDDAIAEGKMDEREVSPSLPSAKQSKSSLLERATEYLFDIFDANCMEEYAIINRFEERAIKAFPVRSDASEVDEEISFEQERLHNEFLGIFEDLLERFLRAENMASAEFFELVRANFHGGRKMCQAIEIVDVIFCYTDITQWHAMMRENVHQRRRYESQKRSTPLQEALNAEPKKNKEPHRLDDDL